MPRDFQGDGPTKVLLHQGQAQVDAGRYTGRGPHRALLDENRVGLHRQQRVLARQFFTAGPVGGHPTAIEQAAGGQQKAPVHTEAMRRVCWAFCFTHATNSASSAAPYTPQPPAITSVSHGVSAAGKGSANSAKPAEVITGVVCAAITEAA